jgi:hypothetical protein
MKSTVSLKQFLGQPPDAYKFEQLQRGRVWRTGLFDQDDVPSPSI